MKKQVISDALWIDVGDYTVLRNGRIFKNRNRRNAKKRKVREVKQWSDGRGYLQFKYNGKMKSSHRFIAEVFISNPENLPQINHRSEKHSRPEDNSPLNLEWCTAGQNINYGSRNERVSRAMTNGKLSKTVYQYTLDGLFLREWPSTMEVQRQLGFHNSYIGACCRGRRKSLGGYIWSYTPLH